MLLFITIDGTIDYIDIFTFINSSPEMVMMFLIFTLFKCIGIL